MKWILVQGIGLLIWLAGGVFLIFLGMAFATMAIIGLFVMPGLLFIRIRSSPDEYLHLPKVRARTIGRLEDEKANLMRKLSEVKG
jgi:hypothetical protein